MSSDAEELARRIAHAKTELERMIDLHPQGMFLAGPSGEVLRTNAGLLKLLGLTGFPEVLGRSCEELFPASDGKSPLADFFADPHLGPEDMYVRETEIARPEGGRRALRFTVVGSGTEDRFMVLVDDVTEEKEAAARRERQEKREVAEALTGALNHALNQPLSVIMGRAQLLLFSLEKGRANAEELRPALQEIVNLTRRVAETLRRARTFRDFVTETYLEGVDILDLNRSTNGTENRDAEDAGSDQA